MWRNFSRLFSLFFIALALVGCNVPQVSLESTATPVATATEIPQPTEAASPTPILNPNPDTLYLGKFQGQDAIFISFYDENGGLFNMATLATDAVNVQPFDFRDLEMPQELFVAQPQTAISNFLFDEKRERLFVSLVMSDEALGFRNDIYRVVPATRDYQKIWTNDLSKSRYDDRHGAATISQASGNYLVLSIAGCYACDSMSTSPIVVVVNIPTGAEKVLGAVGNVLVKPDVNTVSYQKLEETKTVCDPAPGCNDGYQLTYAPAGDVLEATLP